MVKYDYQEILVVPGPKASKDYTFGKQINMADFALVRIINGNTIWKSTTFPNQMYIYMRKDILAKYPKLVPRAP